MPRDPDLYDGQRPTTAVERLVAAPPVAVWPVVIDPDLPARFSDEFQAGEWLDAGGPAVGTRFRGRNHNERMGTWHTVCHVVECEAPVRYGWAVDDPAWPNAMWRFALEAVDGATLLRHEVVLGPGRSGLTWAIRQRPDRRDELIAWRLADLRRNMQAVVDGVAELFAPDGDAPTAAGP